MKVVNPAGLVHALQEGGPFTVFAENHAALSKLYEQTLKTSLRPEFSLHDCDVD